MAERAYYIRIDGQNIDVTEEVYKTYYNGRRKERYMTQDLKQEHFTIDQQTGKVTIKPSREDSLDRLLETDKQFATGGQSTEDAAITAIMIEQLEELLHTLSADELALIHELFYLDKTHREVAAALGISSTTVHYRKHKLLEKLRGLLNG